MSGIGHQSERMCHEAIDNLRYDQGRIKEHPNGKGPIEIRRCMAMAHPMGMGVRIAGFPMRFVIVSVRMVFVLVLMHHSGK